MSGASDSRLARDPEARIRALPCWRGDFALERLAGGLSNVSFRVSDASGAYVARVGEDFPFHHVSRAREAAASRWAQAIGVGPKVVYAEDGVMVCGFIDGRTFGPSDVRAGIADIAALLKRVHAGMRAQARGAACFFWAFHVVRDYADLLRRQGHELAPALPRLLSANDALEAAQAPQPIVFGHHDLLPANFIGEGTKIWLVDWEYAAFGTPIFDLANLSANAEFDGAEDARLLALYFEREPDAALMRSFAAMKAASALREALWAYVSVGRLSAPGADYPAYGAACLKKFESCYAAFRRDA
jgi:thiamine kinase-like enzyme